MRISQLVVDFPEIAVLDVPSLFVDPVRRAGGRRLAAAARRGEPPASLSIAPYPAELIEHVVLAGERITIRPIRPEDAEAHGAFFSRLSPEDIRYRFFSAIRELSRRTDGSADAGRLRREKWHSSPIREASGDTVGVARLVCETAHRPWRVRRDRAGRT